MAYIGRDIRTGAFRQLDDISSGFDGSDTTHTMQVNSTNVSVGDVNQILLSLGGVIQKPGTDFTVSGSTLTFTTAPAANTSFFAILLGSDNGGTVTPTDASVTTAKLADTSVTSAKLSGNIDAPGTLSTTLSNSTQTTPGLTINNTVSGGYGAALAFDVFRSDSSSQATAARIYPSRADVWNSDAASDADLNFQVSQDGTVATRMTVSGTGDVSVTDGNLLFSGSGHGVYLGVTSATSANLLDDYEVGTFTPHLSTTGTNFTSIGYNTQTGEYVKVGDLVIAHARVTLNSFTAGSPSGNAVVASLPFTSKDTTDMASSIGFVSNINFDISSFGTIDVGATTSANNTRVNLTRTRNNGTADGVPHQAVTSSSTDINIVAIYKTA